MRQVHTSICVPLERSPSCHSQPKPSATIPAFPPLVATRSERTASPEKRYLEKLDQRSQCRRQSSIPAIANQPSTNEPQRSVVFFKIWYDTSVPTGKLQVVAMVRVSKIGQAEDEKTGLDRQRRDIRFTCNHFNLGVVKEFPLVVTGAQVQRTPEVRELQRWIQRTDIQGLVIPSIDRLSRDDRFSSVGDLMRPFEEIMGGKSTKRIWTRKDELDVTVRSDRQKIWDALNYAAVEREMIAFRTGEGRDILRQSETAKIDKLPFYVKFTPFDAKVNEGKFSWIPEYRAMMA